MWQGVQEKYRANLEASGGGSGGSGSHAGDRRSSHSGTVFSGTPPPRPRVTFGRAGRDFGMVLGIAAASAAARCATG